MYLPTCVTVTILELFYTAVNCGPADKLGYSALILCQEDSFAYFQSLTLTQLPAYLLYIYSPPMQYLLSFSVC